MKRAACTLLAGMITAFLVTLVAVPAQADPADFYELGNDTYETYRAPWPERDAWEVGIGGAKGVGEHSSCCGQNREFAIDLNQPGDGNIDCGAPLRAVRSGKSVFFSVDESLGYGNLLGIKHVTGESSWYAHLEDDTPVQTDGVALPQGDYVALAGKTGSSGDPPFCHLHFQVHDNQANPHNGTYNTINICMGGTYFSGSSPCSDKGFDLTHLSLCVPTCSQGQRNTPHPSNNTGPGYGRPGAPAWLDPGSATSPLSSGFEGIWFLAAVIVAFDGEPGSTFASLQGTCATNRNWVKSCNGLDYTQNFLEPTSTWWLSVPQSMTEGPNGAKIVRGGTWKAYGRQCTGSLHTYEQIGRPTTGETGGGANVSQQFEFGSILRDDSNPFSTSVNVFNSQGGLICSFTGLNDFHTGACYDVDGDGSVNFTDLFIVLGRLGETEAQSSYDDRYDPSRNGIVDTADTDLIQLQIGTQCT